MGNCFLGTTRSCCASEVQEDGKLQSIYHSLRANNWLSTGIDCKTAMEAEDPNDVKQYKWLISTSKYVLVVVSYHEGNQNLKIEIDLVMI